MIKIYVECKPDKAFSAFIVEKIGLEASIIHEHGKNRVLKKLIENKGSIGLINEDPASYAPKELKEFREAVSNQHINVNIFKSKNGSKIIMLKAPT